MKSEYMSTVVDIRKTKKTALPLGENGKKWVYALFREKTLRKSPIFRDVIEGGDVAKKVVAKIAQFNGGVRLTQPEEKTLQKSPIFG